MKKGKISAIILSLIMVLCMLPLTAMAASAIEISSVEATVTAPVDGATPNFAPVAVGEHYTADSVSWCKSGTVDAPTDPMAATETFEAGETYFAAVTFSPGQGCIFATPLTAKINNMDATLGIGETATFAVAFTVPYPDTTVEIPFEKVVKQGGSAVPGKQAFDLEIFDMGNSGESEYEDVTYTAKVETNGANKYEGKIVITGPADQIENFISEGFSIREKNSGVENWTYSTAAYYASPIYDNATYEITGFEYYPLHKTADGFEPEENAVDVMSFENTFTAKSPATGDTGSMILWISLLLVSGMGVATAAIVSKKKA